MGPYRHPAAIELTPASERVAFDDDGAGDVVAPMVVPGTRAPDDEPSPWDTPFVRVLSAVITIVSLLSSSWILLQ